MMGLDVRRQMLKQVIYEKIYRRSVGRISGHALSTLRVDCFDEEYNGDILVSLTNQFYAELLLPDYEYIDIVINIPRNWFQVFKLECFPMWLQRFFPVKCKPKSFKYRVKVYAYYPHMPAHFDGGTAYPHVMVEETEEIKGNAKIFVEKCE